jgi:hypothetical protein
MNAVTSTALPSGMSNYYVLPVQDDNGLLSCLYFEVSTGKPVSSKDLNCRAQEGTMDFLSLTRAYLSPLTHQPVLDHTSNPDDVTLFAAVVATKNEPNLLQNTYMANGNQCLVLPVLPGTTRSVILIFALPPEVSSSTVGVVSVGGLVATSDPEIKNSTD